MSAPAKDGPGAFRLVATLTVAGLLSGLAIVGVYEATLPTIRAHQAEALRRAVFEVLPGTERMEPVDAAEVGRIYAGYSGDVLVGYAIPGEGAGFQDTIRLLFGFDPGRQRVTGMEILESRETPGLGDRIFKDAAFVGAFRDLAVEPSIELVQDGATAPHQVDAISGATISSRAVVEIINGSLEVWRPQLPATGGAGGAEEAPHE
jgi:electron transport complex protein RnfG